MALDELTDNKKRDSRQLCAPDAVTNREYRSTVFTSYFGDPVNAAQLYEGMCRLDSLREERDGDGGSPGSMEDQSISPEDIVFETLEGVLYLARKNDLAFTVRRKVLVIGEHQSTINRNMPLRSAIYYGRTMEKIIDPRAIYRTKLIPIPTPEFYVFYNGKERQPLEQTLYLSDSYLEQTRHPMLQLAVKVININLSEAHPILEKCRPLYEYSWFIGKVREHLEKNEGRDRAVKEAIEACMRQNIMTEFIAKHSSEVRNMLFTEFNLEDAKEVWQEEAWEDGVREGRIEGQKEGRREGAERTLIEMTVKKFRKGKSPEAAANELETDIDKIQAIYRIAGSFASDCDTEAILEAMRNIERK